MATLSKDERLLLARVEGRLDGTAKALERSAYNPMVDGAIAKTLRECIEALKTLRKEDDHVPTPHDPI